VVQVNSQQSSLPMDYSRGATNSGQGGSPAIQFRNVSKRFLLRTGRSTSIQEMVINALKLRRQSSAQELWALRDVSFVIAQGETVGIIGPNGSGKSTLLKVATGILEPTSGKVRFSGRMSSLLELGTGFHPDLTGRENVYLYGSILGLSRRYINRRFPEIVAFAELEQFIDMPAKYYSSGMYVRLGFAVATQVDPEILLIDEVLAVGDEHFQRKCLARIEDLQRAGVTILLVSHNLAAVQNLCHRALWLNEGRMRELGAPECVIRRYLEHVNGHEERAPIEDIGVSA
jgi:lipopolysaccharide transport system ATP-binding protein